MIDYPIPGNDDAIRSIKLIGTIVEQTLTDGRQEFKQLALEKEIGEAQEAAQVEDTRFNEKAAAARVPLSGLEGDEIIETEEEVVSKLENKEEKPRAKKTRAKKE